VATLSEWLRLMLAEIARKQAEREQARVEDERRRAEQQAGGRRARSSRRARRR